MKLRPRISDSPRSRARPFEAKFLTFKIVFGAFAGIALRAITGGGTQADHQVDNPSGPEEDHDHIASVATIEHETACVWIDPGTLEDHDPPVQVRSAEAWKRITDTLIDAAGWKRLANYAFIPDTIGPCGSYPRYLLPELRYNLRDCAYNYAGNCVVHDNYLEGWNQPFINPASGHREYIQADIVIMPESLDNDECYPATTPPPTPWPEPETPEITSYFCVSHAVNHETGHALGLRDVNRNGDHPEECIPATSVMHNLFECAANYAWPSNADLASVSSLFADQINAVNINSKAY